MNLVSISFYLFLAVFLLIYFTIPKKYQWVVSLVGSYIFYIFSNLFASVYLIVTTVSTFFVGKWIDNSNQLYANKVDSIGFNISNEEKKELKHANKRRKTILLASALALNFGILAFLKYFNLFSTSANYLLNVFNISGSVPVHDFLLPLGISFYTFQSIGYIIDVFREKIKPDTNIGKYALFVSFFPQIIQGPIGRYDELAHQLFRINTFDYKRVKFGAQLILWGLFKKLVIADRAAILVNSIFDSYTQHQGLTIFVGVLLYSIQIYGDFSGGIDIARGIAQMMGITLRENFKRPFFATSIEDYWRRWHISLSEWMRDYIFYPLALSRSFAKIGKKTRKIFGPYLGKLIPIFLAQLITFLTVGIWHGANWKFVIFGLYNGFFIIVGILLEPFLKKFFKQRKIVTNTFSWRFFNIVLTFFLVCISRYFSRAPDLYTALRMIKRTFSVFNPWVLTLESFTQFGLNERNIYLLIVAVVVLFFVDLLQENGYHLREKIAEQNLVFRWMLYLIAIFSILIFGIYGVEYNQTDFIYRGF